MSCCGTDDNDDDGVEDLLLHHPLLSQQSAAEAAATADPLPMSSSFLVLASTDVLRSILEILPPRDLARAACVCRTWNLVASERQVLEKTFASPWSVRRVIGEPSSPAFWRHPGLGRFAISHRLCRGDTVASLALKYSVQVMDIKRVNNMMSDHGIYSRVRLLIPICKPDILHDRTCYIEMDIHAKREVAVLYLEGHPDPDFLVRHNYIVTQDGKKKILDSIKRSMGVDDGTAEYYMSISSGDPRAAIQQFSEDLRWEQHRGAL